jgi:hypothetical protein
VSLLNAVRLITLSSLLFRAPKFVVPLLLPNPAPTNHAPILKLLPV